MSRTVGTRPLPSPPVITPCSRLSLGADLSMISAAAAVTGVSPWSDAANCLLACPFVLEVQTVFYKGFWVNGSAAGGNTEVGIWDDAFNKIITTGSVAGSGNSVPQAGDITDTTLPPGQYYMGIAHSATTTNQLSRWTVATFGAALWQAHGCWRQSGITLGSLAATATPGDMTNVAFPYYGLITRSAFDV